MRGQVVAFKLPEPAYAPVAEPAVPVAVAALADAAYSDAAGEEPRDMQWVYRGMFALNMGLWVSILGAVWVLARAV